MAELSLKRRDHEVLTGTRHNVINPFPTDIRASQIYHLACPASPVHFAKDPISILETCFLGTRNALEAARQWKAKLLLASTSEVYGDAQQCPQTEDYFGNVNPFGPRSCYDEGKRVAEALVFAYRHEHSLDLKVARIFNAYGPGMRGSDGRVISSFISRALRGEDVLVNGSGDATRSFQYVDDCVGGLRALMESAWNEGPMNLGCEAEISINDLARIIVQRVAAITGNREVGIKYRDAMVDDPMRRRPDCSLARKVLNWNTKVELADGLGCTIGWHMQDMSA
jgi:UDP-glucuronate decarboxylase